MGAAPERSDLLRAAVVIRTSRPRDQADDDQG
jgi:hypothetical protein